MTTNLKPPTFFNDIGGLNDWRPTTEAEKIAFNILRQYIHRSPVLFMKRVCDTITTQINQAADKAYRQGKLDAIQSIQDNHERNT